MLQKISRVIARAVKNPRAELQTQFWNLRVWLFVYKINDRHWYLWNTYPDYLAHGNAAQFIQDKVFQYCHGKGLDIGGGKWPLASAIVVDDGQDMNAYNLSSVADNSLDYVFSSHCLEHLARWEDALALWLRKIKAGGILFLYLPHASMKMWQPGGPWVRDNHVWAPTAGKLIPILERNGMKILDYNPDKDHAWSFHIVAIKTGNKI